MLKGVLRSNQTMRINGGCPLQPIVGLRGSAPPIRWGLRAAGTPVNPLLQRPSRPIASVNFRNATFYPIHVLTWSQCANAVERFVVLGFRCFLANARLQSDLVDNVFIRIARDYHVQFRVTTSAASPEKCISFSFSSCLPRCLTGTCNRCCNPSVRWSNLATRPRISAWSWSFEMMRLQDAAS